MSKVWVTGHKNPDTDSICSAIAYATFKNKYEKSTYNYVPIRLGVISSETDFVLNYFDVRPPMLKEKVATGENVIQVDHNEETQTIAGINEANILEIVDHHRVNGIFTREPIYIRIEPVGCTATIIAKMFSEKGIVIDKKTAGLLMSAIISDSLLFKSPTCTEEDEKMCHYLSTIAGVNDVEKYGFEFLKAGSSLVGKTVETIFMTDFKEFSVNDNLFGIAQVNSLDIDGFNKTLRTDMLAYMKTKMHEKPYRFLLLAVTDIVNEGSLMLAVGDLPLLEKAFSLSFVDNGAYAKGILSRKKQMTPILTDNLT